jgi:hypothetical protein
VSSADTRAYLGHEKVQFKGSDTEKLGKIITEKYHGYMRSQYIEDSFETMIVIPILNRKRYF